MSLQGHLLAIPQPWLYTGILVFATMGTIAADLSPVELIMLKMFGVLGFLMRRFDYPSVPVIVGLILRLLAESQLVEAPQRYGRVVEFSPISLEVRSWHASVVCLVAA